MSYYNSYESCCCCSRVPEVYHHGRYFCPSCYQKEKADEKWKKEQEEQIIRKRLIDKHTAEIKLLHLLIEKLKEKTIEDITPFAALLQALDRK
jgi:uncharacterized Zn finger protein (UPF0148 family)